MTSEGCDSLVTLHLFVQPTIQNSITANICDGQSYTLGTQTLNTTGTYSELFTTVSGCDSVVTLFLNVDAVIDTTITVDICEGDTYVLGIQTLSIWDFHRTVHHRWRM